jgi:hypothetical protein
MHYRPPAALAEGGQAAFLACAVLAGTGTALALIPPAGRGRQRTSCQARPGGRCRCRRRRGGQARSEMNEQRTDSYHARRLRRR